MALTASPYSGNDYTAVSTRPINLPVNDIMKAFVAKNQYWEEGARRVKSVYENALDLSLTKTANRVIKDDYLRNAQEEIKKLSASDMGDVSVQRAGISVFTPLLKDEGIMSDDQATKYISRVNAEALNFRNRDGGKEYSATNHAYALDGAAEFQDPKNTDRMAGKKYLQQAKEYTPYYDTTTEMLNIKSKCGDVSNTSTSIDQGYINSVTNAGTSADKLHDCITSGLSDKALKQFQINGYVQYGKNYKALGDDYVHTLNQTEQQIRAKMAVQAGYITATGKNALSPDMQKYYTSENELLNKRLANVQQSRNNIMAGDYKELQTNYESIAGSVFTNRALTNFSNSFYTAKHEEKKQADGWQTALLTQQGMNTRQERDFKHDVEMQDKKHDDDMELMYGKALTKMGAGIAGLYSQPQQFFSSATETQTPTYDNLLTTIEGAQMDHDKTLKDMFISMKNTNLGDQWLADKDVSFLSTPKGMNEFYNWAKSYNQGLIDKKDILKGQQLKPFFDQLSTAAQTLDINNSIKAKVDNSIAPEVMARFNNGLKSVYSSLKPFTMDGQTISATRQKAILTGNDSEYEVRIQKSEPGLFGDMTSGGGSSRTINFVNKRTGVNYTGYADMKGLPQEFYQAIKKYTDLTDRSKSEFKGKADDVLGKQYATQMATFAIDKTREANTWKEMIATRVAPSDKDFSKQIGVLNSPLTGSATFRVPKSFGSGNEKTDVSDEDIKRTLSSEFGNSTVSEVKDSPDGKFLDVTIKDKSFNFSPSYSSNREALLQLANIYQRELQGPTKETNKQLAQGMSPVDLHSYSINIDRNKNAYIYDKTTNQAIQSNLPIERAIQVYNALIQGNIK